MKISELIMIVIVVLMFVLGVAYIGGAWQAAYENAHHITRACR